MNVRARRSVEVTLTLGAQEAADLMALLADAADGADGDLLGFYEDLSGAIREGLAAEGVTVQPRVVRQAQHAPSIPGVMYSYPGVPDRPVLPELDAPPRAYEVDASQAASVEPTAGRKPVFK